MEMRGGIACASRRSCHSVLNKAPILRRFLQRRLEHPKVLASHDPPRVGVDRSLDANSPVITRLVGSLNG
jgi:hypothetical protein